MQPHPEATNLQSTKMFFCEHRKQVHFESPVFSHDLICVKKKNNLLNCYRFDFHIRPIFKCVRRRKFHKVSKQCFPPISHLYQGRKAFQSSEILGFHKGPKLPQWVSLAHPTDCSAIGKQPFVSLLNIIEITAPGKPSCLETGKADASHRDIKTFK